MPPSDPHPIYFACLGPDHAQAAVGDPTACPACSSLPPKALAARAAAFEDDTLPPSPDPQLTAGVANVPPQEAPLPGGDAEDSVSLFASDESLPGEELPPEEDTRTRRADSAAMAVELYEVAQRAAARLGLAWPDPPPTEAASLSDCFLGSRPAPAKQTLPGCPTFLADLKKSWDHPFSARAPLQGCVPFFTLDGAASHGLVDAPRVEEAVANYLSPSGSAWTSSPSLPSKPCRTTATLAEKAYVCAAQNARALNTVSLLQGYQGDLLTELAMRPSPLAVHEMRRANDLAAFATRCAVQAQGRVLCSLVALTRHLWLNLSQLGEKERKQLMDSPVSADGLFGEAFEARGQRMEAAQKSSAALQSLLPKKTPPASGPPSSGPQAAADSCALSLHCHPNPFHLSDPGCSFPDPNTSSSAACPTCWCPRLEQDPFSSSLPLSPPRPSGEGTAAAAVMCAWLRRCGSSQSSVAPAPWPGCLPPLCVPQEARGLSPLREHWACPPPPRGVPSSTHCLLREPWLAWSVTHKHCTTPDTILPRTHGI